MKRKISLERRAQIGMEKRTRTRAAILSVAFDLLGREKGRSTRIEEICEAAGISRGTFYNYFASIDELFDALTYEISHDFNDAVQRTIQALPPGAERTAAALRYYLHRTRQDPVWGWAMVNLSSAGPIFGAETYRQATQSIEEGMATGEFDVPDVTVGRDLMMGTMLASMITLLSSEQPADHPEAVVRQIFKGLGVPSRTIELCVTASLPDPEGQAGAADEAMEASTAG